MEGARDQTALARATAAVVLAALAFEWLLLALLDLRENDGLAPIIAMFGIPALASAVIIQLVADKTPPRQRLNKAVLWWAFAVFPAGTLGAFIVALLRDPDYFLMDGPWMVMWIPIFVGVGLLLGALVWFFFVFPLVTLVRVIGHIVGGRAKLGAVVLPLVLLGLGVICVIGGLSIDTDRSGQRAWGAIVASFLGVPGAYQVVWEPGLWIVRGIIAAIVLVFAVPALVRRIRNES